MSVATFTKAGAKASVPAKLDKGVFGVEVKNHELLQQAYLANLANQRSAGAKTKKRGEVSGGGIKPWRQKGTGRARVGSNRSPIWRGGGITFGPTGDQNYTHSLTTASKRHALRQALSLAANADKIIIVESFEAKDGKTASVVKLLSKIGADKNVMLVVAEKDPITERATKNLASARLVLAKYLSVTGILDADHIVIDQKSLEVISDWLVKAAPKAKKETEK